MLQLQSSKQEPSFIRYNHYVDFIRPHVESAKSLSAVLTKAISGLAVFEPRVGSCACAVRGLGLFFQLRGLQGSHTPCSGPLVPQHTSVRRRGWEGSRARRTSAPGADLSLLGIVRPHTHVAFRSEMELVVLCTPKSDLLSFVCCRS